MSTASQAQALIALIADWRDQECAALAEGAAQETRRLRKEALAAARQQVHTAIEAARIAEKHAQQVHDAERLLQTRASALQTERQLLATGMDLLRQRLQARWQQQAARESWLRMALQQAAAMLSAHDWQVDHPAAWPAEEQTAFARAAQAQGQGAPRFLVCPELAGGVRICAGGACLDATIDGLLHDPAVAAAHLLALLRKTANE